MPISWSMRLAVVVASVLTAAPLSWGQAEALKLDQILSRMQQARAAERDHSIPYTVTREYQLLAQGTQQAKSQVLAQVRYVPPSEREYTILQSEGSERGTGIVRKVLEHETRMATDPHPHEISADNYDIALLGRETFSGHDCYVLQLTPRREAVELVRGKAWVDANGFQLRRVEGKTSKNPSFWIKNLNVTVDYGEVNGVWVQTSTRAVADVRLIGPHVLTSRELDVRAATFNARSRPPARARERRANSRRGVADAATWVAR